MPAVTIPTEDEERPHKAFLEELTALSKKYGVTIWGCGCCASPSIEHMSEDERDGEYAPYGSDNYCDIKWVTK